LFKPSDEVLDPAGSWPDRKEYDKRYRDPAARFIESFKKFEYPALQEVMDAEPKV
jgi:ATP-dependent phosphoenolpyruvate carboxykinase